MTDSKGGQLSMEAKDSNPARLIRAGEGETLGHPEAVRDRFLIERTGGGASFLQHLMPGRALAAPLHRHSREDEYSFVLEGRVGALLGDEEVLAEPGDLLFKPKGQWHTFWNAGDEPARILEVIVPGGFEQAFREMHDLGEALYPDEMVAIAERYGCDVDFERIPDIIQRHGLTF
jgi:mannose-6-phosphate isomerase-like protein (cupin superfamily)